MKRCDDFYLLLSPWIDQETSAELSAEIEAHLESCSSCAAEVAAMRRIDGLLELQIDAAEVSDRVLSEIASRRPGLSWWLRTAAAVIVSVGVGFAAGGVMTGDSPIAQDSTRSVAVLGMIDDHFGSNALVGIDDLARDLARGEGANDEE